MHNVLMLISIFFLTYHTNNLQYKRRRYLSDEIEIDVRKKVIERIEVCYIMILKTIWQGQEDGMNEDEEANREDYLSENESIMFIVDVKVN